MYGPLVNSGGMIVFHDIVPHPPAANTYVEPLWNEIKKDYQYEEIIVAPEEPWAGIGVLYKD